MRLWTVMLATLTLCGCMIGSGLNISEKDLAGKPNLLNNGGFETISVERGAAPVGWIGLAKDGGFQATPDSLNPFTGSRSLRMRPNSDHLLLYSEDFPVRPRAAYHCRLAIRSDGNERRPVILRMAAFDPLGTCVDQAVYRFVPGNEWFNMEMDTGFFKRTAVSARLIVELPPAESDQYWLDEAAVIEAFVAPYTKP
jgi:hypothetical protein